MTFLIQYIIYPIFLRVYYWGIFIASFFNKKAKKWIEGRKNWFWDIGIIGASNGKIPPQLKSWRDKPEDYKLNKRPKRIWIHTSSLGEFEQARPLIKALKETLPHCQIICTFFSPSGYEIRKDYKAVNWVGYLPLDTRKNAKFWAEKINADVVLWVKYDIWVNFLVELKKQGIPVLLFSSIFRKEQHYFRWYGQFFKRGLESFEHIFVQNESSESLLKKHNLSNVSVAHDTRFDRVWNNAQNPKEIPVITALKQDKKLLIAGSTWQEDEKLLIEIINNKQQNNNYKFIIAPHEIHHNNIQKLKDEITLPCLCYSEIQQKKITNFDVLIIDNIGLLSSIYQYGDIAYIGGGFGTGIHNILEAAVFDLPVIFGPEYHKFQEAKDLIKEKFAISIKNTDELLSAIYYFEQHSVENKNYVASKMGGTARVMEKVLEVIKITS